MKRKTIFSFLQVLFVFVPGKCFWSLILVKWSLLLVQDPDGEIENSGIFFTVESRTSVIFKLQFLTLAIYKLQRLGLSKSATMKKCEKRLFYFHIFFLWLRLSPNRCRWQIVLVKNYNLNVTEVRYPAFSVLFHGVFNFTVGVLIYD